MHVNKSKALKQAKYELEIKEQEVVEASKMVTIFSYWFNMLYSVLYC